MNVLKNHHYVSQFYLRFWSNKNDNKVFVNINDKIVPMKIDKICSSNYFYKITEIDDFTKNIILKELESFKLLHFGELLKDIVKGLSFIYKLNLIFNNDDIEIEKNEKLLKSNMIEGVYGIIEDLAAPSLKKIIIKKDIDFMDYQNILRYCLFQLTRTNQNRQNAIKSIEDIIKDKTENKEVIYILHSLVLSERLVFSLLEKMFKITIIFNNTNKNFITTDNPIINLFPIESNKLKLYLPLTVKIAIFIEESNLLEEKQQDIKNKFINENLIEDRYFIDNKTIENEKEVIKLNNKLLEYKDRFIISMFVEDLEEVQNEENYKNGKRKI